MVSMSKMNIVGIITARGGSKGVKDKNIIPLLGKPIIYYTIKRAKESKLLDKIVCSTEDERIARIVQEYGVEVIRRPSELARDTSPIEDVLRHAVKELQQGGFNPGIVVLLYANVPVRAGGIIDKTIKKMISTHADCVLTVENVGKFHPYWMLKVDNSDKLIYYTPDKNLYQRQMLPRLYIHDGSVLAVKKDVLMKGLSNDRLYSSFGEDIRVIIQQPGDTVEIDDRYDLSVAEILLKKTQEL
jgi:CMP-N-acetylneuraminic acid synthetase